MGKSIFKVGAVLCGLALAGAAHAAPISFDVSGGSYSVGTGYGCGGPGNTTTLFCAAFTSTIGNPAPFSLSAVGEFQDLTFGTIQMNEDANDIVAGETDNLNVTAILNFIDPFAGSVQSVAVVGIFTGAINDGAVDYSLTFSPVTQAFGTGGEFSVDFGDLSWTSNATFTHTARITLTRLPENDIIDPPPTTNVPEPATLALFGAGLAGLGLLRRRRAA